MVVSYLFICFPNVMIYFDLQLFCNLDTTVRSMNKILFEFLDFSIDDVDNDTLVSEVLAGMMNKEINTGIDLGMTSLKKRIHDPTPKMDIRHKQVSRWFTYLISLRFEPKFPSEYCTP